MQRALLTKCDSDRGFPWGRNMSSIPLAVKGFFVVEPLTRYAKANISLGQFPLEEGRLSCLATAV